MPGVQIGQNAIGSEVELQGRDGDKALRQRADIGAAFRDSGGRVATDPVIGLIAWIHAFIQL